MIPVTYPSSLSYRTTRQMVAYPITDLTGKRRWTDYIPVKFVDQTTFTVENSHNNNAYISVDMLSSNANLKEGIDYIPVYIDNAATDAWQVSATGYIPVGYSGAALSLQFAGATTLDSRITFTRASSARYFNNQGILTSAGNNVARFDHDPVTKAPRGLLIEEQRTNLLTYSEQFDNAAWTKNSSVSIAANTSVAPDGTTTADTMTADSGLGVYQNVTTTIGTNITQSVFIKAGTATAIMFRDDTGAGRHIVVNPSTGAITSTNGTLLGSSSTSVGNGWYRISFSYTADTTNVRGLIRPDSAGAAQTVLIWGAQTEAGAFPTSYIPTVAAQVTRSADSASMTGSNFSSWYRADEGTFYAEASAPQASPAYDAILVADDGTDNNRITLSLSNGSGPSRGFVSIGTGGAALANLTSGATPYVPNSIRKIAYGVKGGDYAFTANSNTAATSTQAGVPTGVANLRIGCLRGPQFFLNGHIRKLAFYPARLSNAHLQALTR